MDWTALLTGLAGGAIGVLLTWVAAFWVRMSRIGREIEANDRALGVIDDHLETWVCDDTVRLRRELGEISERMNPQNLFWSGTHAKHLALAKEAALHAYRDQERTARSQEAEISAREGRLHGLVRLWRFEPIGLQAPDRVRPILNAWAAPVTRHIARDVPTGDKPFEINDPRRHNVETTLADLAADPYSLT
jgi:hypothetical protein